MLRTLSSLRPRRVLSYLPVLALSLACLAPVDGERAATGDCPAGERCSAATPEGLVFVGQTLFDGAGLPRLGPIVAGGSLEVGLERPGDAALPAFAAETTNAAVILPLRGDDFFGPPTESGEPSFAVEAHLNLVAATPGEAFLRIVDPTTGELFDRTSFVVVDVDDVRLRNVSEPERDHLLAGCTQMVGVELLGNQDGIEVRAIDDGMRVWADGVELEREPSLWDCVAVTPAEVSPPAPMRFVVDVGPRRYERTLAVRTLASEGLTACPARAD